MGARSFQEMKIFEESWRIRDKDGPPIGERRKEG
jgi:hypothetical protein